MIGRSESHSSTVSFVALKAIPSKLDYTKVELKIGEAWAQMVFGLHPNDQYKSPDAASGQQQRTK